MLPRLFSRIAKVRPAHLAREFDRIAHVAREVGRAAPGLHRGESALLIDYPPHERPRHADGGAPQAAIAALLEPNRDAYRAMLEGFLALKSRFTAIPVHGRDGAAGPLWFNGWLPALDSVAVYGFLAANAPATYLEIGSGHSTMFARRAIGDLGLRTRIVSIDPQPRAEIDALCDEVIRSPLEDADLSVFDRLVPGDIVFFDGSHRVLMNSDATVFFLEVLPRLKPGVLVQVHDVHLPWDYPAEWATRHYSEQYLLAAALLFGSQGLDVRLPCWFVSQDPELSRVLEPLWRDPAMLGAERHGVSFWFTRKG